MTVKLAHVFYDEKTKTESLVSPDGKINHRFYSAPEMPKPRDIKTLANGNKEYRLVEVVGKNIDFDPRVYYMKGPTFVIQKNKVIEQYALVEHPDLDLRILSEIEDRINSVFFAKMNWLNRPATPESVLAYMVLIHEAERALAQERDLGQVTEPGDFPLLDIEVGKAYFPNNKEGGQVYAKTPSEVAQAILQHHDNLKLRMAHSRSQQLALLKRVAKLEDRGKVFDILDNAIQPEERD